MVWTDEDEANKVHKLLKCGVLYPEDLTANEIRVLKHHRPQTHHFVTTWLEFRQDKIERGKWSEEADPPDTDRRLNRLESGDSVVEPYND